MALVLTGGSLYVIRYTDEKGAERTVRVKKGTDVETLGLPNSVVEELAKATYSENPKRYWFTRGNDKQEPKKATVRIKASKNEAAVPPSTISMVGMRKELAASRAENADLKREKKQHVAEKKNDGIVRAWSNPSFDNEYEVEKRQAQEAEAKAAAEENAKKSEPEKTDEAPKEDSKAVSNGVEGTVEMDAEVKKDDEAPKKAPIKRTTGKKAGGKKSAKSKSNKKQS